MGDLGNIEYLEEHGCLASEEFPRQTGNGERRSDDRRSDAALGNSPLILIPCIDRRPGRWSLSAALISFEGDYPVDTRLLCIV
ncbi:hypothetical protein D3C87_1348250 [compost metagenome]